MAALDPTAVGGLSADQMKAFDPTAMAGFDQGKVAALDPTAVGGLSADQMKAFDPTAMAGLIRVRWLRWIRQQWVRLMPSDGGFDPALMAGFDQSKHCA